MDSRRETAAGVAALPSTCDLDGFVPRRQEKEEPDECLECHEDAESEHNFIADDIVEPDPGEVPE